VTGKPSGFPQWSELNVNASTCRFVTEFDGVSTCQDPAWDLGFCRFHREALDQGDIDEDGVMSDSVSDQKRRRAINYHGMPNLPINPDLI
jgi:hypothetical protein